MLVTQLVRTQEKARRTVGKNLYHFREYQNHHKPTVGRNRHIKSAVGEGSEEVRNMLLETGVQKILVIYRSRKLS